MARISNGVPATGDLLVDVYHDCDLGPADADANPARRRVEPIGARDNARVSERSGSSRATSVSTGLSQPVSPIAIEECADRACATEAPNHAGRGPVHHPLALPTERPRGTVDMGVRIVNIW
jgi:hypothetical protein